MASRSSYGTWCSRIQSEGKEIVPGGAPRKAPYQHICAPHTIAGSEPELWRNRLPLFRPAGAAQTVVSLEMVCRCEEAACRRGGRARSGATRPGAGSEMCIEK